jgi:hypothetical protein
VRPEVGCETERGKQGTGDPPLPDSPFPRFIFR